MLIRYNNLSEPVDKNTITKSEATREVTENTKAHIANLIEDPMSILKPKIEEYAITKDQELKIKLIRIATAMNNENYFVLRDSVSDSAKNLKGKSKFNLYELSAWMMNSRREKFQRLDLYAA